MCHDCAARWICALRARRHTRQKKLMCSSCASSCALRSNGPSHESPETDAAKSGSCIVQLVPGPNEHARMAVVQVVLRKLGRGTRAVVGRLVRAPRKGSVVVVEFSDGLHEYVTTPVKRVLRLAGRDIFYIETLNSRYRLEVSSRDLAFDGALSGS